MGGGPVRVPSRNFVLGEKTYSCKNSILKYETINFGNSMSMKIGVRMHTLCYIPGIGSSSV